MWNQDQKIGSYSTSDTDLQCVLEKKTPTAPTGDHTALVTQATYANGPFYLWRYFRDNGKTNRTKLGKKKKEKEEMEGKEGRMVGGRKKKRKERERKKRECGKKKKAKKEKELKKGNQKIRSLG